MRILQLALATLVGISFPAGGQEAKKNAGSPTEVVIDGLKALPPADWQSEKPANRLRSHQFRVPKLGDDKEDAELAILPDVRGEVSVNLERWKEMFQPPEGKTLDDISRVEKFAVGPIQVVYLDVQGTYLHKHRPLAPKSEAKPLPGYRMISVLFTTPENAHLIRLVGPTRTIEGQKKPFDAWLKSFK